MSLFFNNGPGSKRKPGESPMDSGYTSYFKGARTSKRSFPRGLSFEEIVRNNTHSPCSLNDFIEYLMYVERSVENLQFFMWYCDYVEKWIQLSEQEKQRSPVWISKKRANHRPHSWSAMLGERTDKLNRIFMILEQTTTKTTQLAASAKEPDSKTGRAKTNFSRPRTPASKSEVTEETLKEWQWQPFSAQPFRDEVTQIVSHYVSARGPRKLSLTHQDRTTCMHALQHTTHPSAFLPAFLTAEKNLREYSHPNFISWSICNCNHPRVLFARVLGTLLIVLAVVLNVVLILSNLNRLVRLSSLPLWYGGLYVWLIEGRGLSVSLYMNCKRQLRRWEQVANIDPKNTDSGENAGKAEPRNPTDSLEHEGNDAKGMDVRRKKSLEAPGSANDFEGETWVKLYQEKPTW